MTWHISGSQQLSDIPPLPPYLELQLVVSCQVGAADQILVLWKRITALNYSAISLDLVFKTRFHHTKLLAWKCQAGLKRIELHLPLPPTCTCIHRLP